MNSLETRILDFIFLAAELKHLVVLRAGGDKCMCQLSGAVLVGVSAHFVNIFLTLTASLGSKGEIHFLQLKKTVPQREQGHSYC